MKAKLKSANGFVRFLLNHGEKLGIAAVLVVAGLLIYKSLGRETLGEDKQPEQLKTVAKQAQDKVEGMTWESIPENERTDVGKFIARSGEVVITPVRSSDFPPILPPNPPVIEPLKLRTDPVLLTVVDPEVDAGSGLWMSANPQVLRQKMIEAAKAAAREQQEREAEARRAEEEAEDGGRGWRRRGEERGERFGEGGYSGELGGMKTKDGAIVVQPRGGAQMQGFEDIRERSWVTVLAKVPIKNQFQMYKDALVGAAGFNANNDQPEYLGYFVQRAEVTDEGQGEWKNLPVVRDSGIIDVMETWPIQTAEIVNPKYVHPLLTFPLPPMVMREWGDEVTHSDMPIQTPEEIMEEQAREQEELQKQPEEKESDDPFAGVIERRTQPLQYGGERPMYMEGGRGMGAEGGRYIGGEMARGPMMEGRGGYGAERGMGMSRMGGGAGSIQELPEKAWDGRTDYYLFRYFDSTVQPGHQYRYRVRLVFMDVNAQQVPRYLHPEVTARLDEEKQIKQKAGGAATPKGYRVSEWSEPSPIAVVPQPGLAFIAAAKPASANNVNSEPEARVVIKSLDAPFAAEVALGDWFTRGSVLNRSQQAQIIWSSVFKPDPDNPESPEFDLLTGLTLLDFDGGEQLDEQLKAKNRNLTAPARAVVMDQAGRLRLKNELDDQQTVREYDLIMQEAEAAARRERERGDERGGRRGGYGEGRGER